MRVIFRTPVWARRQPAARAGRAGAARAAALRPVQRELSCSRRSRRPLQPTPLPAGLPTHSATPCNAPRRAARGVCCAAARGRAAPRRSGVRRKPGALRRRLLRLRLRLGGQRHLRLLRQRQLRRQRAVVRRAQQGCACGRHMHVDIPALIRAAQKNTHTEQKHPQPNPHPSELCGPGAYSSDGCPANGNPACTPVGRPGRPCMHQGVGYHSHAEHTPHMHAASWRAHSQHIRAPRSIPRPPKCPVGTSQPLAGQRECVTCSNGTYTDAIGQGTPHLNGRKTCLQPHRGLFV